MNKDSNKIGSVAVIGGGIAGIQAALDLAGCGFKVHLVEEKPSVGGVMAQLDKTFPTNDCSACMMGPKLVELSNHPNIEILAYTDVLDLEGTAGQFNLTLKKKARAIDPQKCVGCGICAEKCPVKIADPFNLGLNTRKAAYIPYAQAVPLVYTIDKQHCTYFKNGKCRVCEKVCKNDAIAFDQEDEIITLDTGALIVAGGFEPFDARQKQEYGYGRWPNVITSLQYERMLSAAGPLQGHIQRLSDGQPPRRIAWIQCVGSRDTHLGNDYCSSVCCMSATKQAIITKEHSRDIDTSIFFIDIRAHGKGFDRFYERSASENDVRYVRSMISRVVPNPEDDSLQVAYIGPGRTLHEETFDLIVLSVGLCPNPSTARLAERIGLSVNEQGFIDSDPMDNVSTGSPGVFVCGGAQGPKDIPDSVQQGSAAAARATALLADSRGSLITAPPDYPQRDVSGEQPRIGVFVCHCGVNIAGVVDVQAVADYAAALPDVAYADHCMFACSTDQLKEIQRTIADHRLNRVVVASCTPRTHEPLFHDTLREAGLNPYLFELANIREHDAWVHRAEPEAATHKAMDLVRMSVARARLLEPLFESSTEVVQSALVIGGGLAGLTAALSFARQGFKATLVECTAELGGNARTLYYTEDGTSPAQSVQDLIRSVEEQPMITIYKEARVASISGSCGNFTSQLTASDQTLSISHGVVVIATGGQEFSPTEYLHGRHPCVITQKAFEDLLANTPEKAAQLKRVTMIQCVGSREPDHLYCSRVCCTAAVKNSLKLKSINPHAQVSVLYRDIRTYGFKETAYLKARQQGVRFYRYDLDRKPEVTAQDDALTVRLYDAQLQTDIQLPTDLLVLSAAIRPRPESQELAESFRLPLDDDGFFLEAHPKLRPLDMAAAGFYVCGLAQGPNFAGENVSQARGAVSRALAILSQKEIATEGVINRVDAQLCRACGECEKNCSFEAIKVTTVDSGRQQAVVTAAQCTGCGVCNVACPTGAASLSHFKDEQINIMIEE